MKRRAVTANRRRSEEDTSILASRRPMSGVSNRQPDSAGIYQSITVQTWPNQICEPQRHAESGKRKCQRKQHLGHDLETIVFLILAILGAALVVIACFTLNLIPATTFSRFLKKISLLSGTTSYDGDEKGHKMTNSKSRIFDLSNTVFFNHEIFEDPYGYSGKSGRLEMETFKGYRIPFGSEYIDDYYAFDDDYQRNPLKEESMKKIVEHYGEDSPFEHDKYCCRRISEHRLYVPNCNTFHEIPMLESQATIIGQGAYRQAMRIELYYGQERETVVVKDIYLEHRLGFQDHEFSRMDAIVAERLSASPRIYSIYGSCGIGIISEFFPNGHVEQIALPDDDIEFRSDDKGPLVCHNDLTAATKLKLSLQMAEALADLHGYPGGPIVHQDVKLDQFFFSADMSHVILSDFNRAEFLLWDHCNENYCLYLQGFGNGNWRAPEEYWDDYLNEKVDVYSMGNNMYALLTGAMPFHMEETQNVQKLVAEGERPYIDPRYKERSLEEAKLVEIIEKCYEYYPADRPSIFEVVNFLRKALKESNDAST